MRYTGLRLAAVIPAYNEGAHIAAVVRGMGDTAVGNVYGSNIANLALVGGISAMIRPIKIEKQTSKNYIIKQII